MLKNGQVPPEIHIKDYGLIEYKGFELNRCDIELWTHEDVLIFLTYLEIDESLEEFRKCRIKGCDLICLEWEHIKRLLKNPENRTLLYHEILELRHVCVEL